jgi:hypothetical protein
MYLWNTFCYVAFITWLCIWLVLDIMNPHTWTYSWWLMPCEQHMASIWAPGCFYCCMPWQQEWMDRDATIHVDRQESKLQLRTDWWVCHFLSLSHQVVRCVLQLVASTKFHISWINICFCHSEWCHICFHIFVKAETKRIHKPRNS